MADTGAGTTLVGLTGFPVEHSISPAMHKAAFAECGLDFDYKLVPAPPEQFEQAIQSMLEQGFAGWNITVPHKQRILGYLHAMSDEVRATGACNTVLARNGQLSGFNTDPAGFMRGLEEAGGLPDGAPAVLLGAGGAARAVAWALSRAGHPVLVLSRRPEQAASIVEGLQGVATAPLVCGSLKAGTLQAALRSASLLVNCTPAGMWPHVDECPLPGGVELLDHLLVYDLVYRPRPTRLLEEATRSGCRTQDGLAMLVGQGAAAFEIWTKRTAPIATMRAACLQALGSPSGK